MNLARLDTNLVVALGALLKHRSVTRAAEQLGVTQPAVSASLARLRRHFGDDLLVRVGNGYRLTPLAHLLEERVRLSLASLERVFDARPDFDPRTSDREFSLFVTDYSLAVLGHRLATTLAAEAPHCRLRLEYSTPATVGQSGQLLLTDDLMLMPHGDALGLSHSDLFEDGWEFVVSADNPRAANGLSIEDLSDMDWVAAFQGPTSSTPAARELRILGVEPRIMVTTQSFAAIPAMIAGSDRVALLQRRLVDGLPEDSGVVAVAGPFEMSPLVHAMWWHPAREADPEHLFIRSVVARAARLGS